MTTANPEAAPAGITAQEWVASQILEAKDDGEPGIYSRRQAFRHPRALLRRWRQLNRVMGTDTSDTWIMNGGVGIAVLIGCIVLSYYAGRGILGNNATAVGLLLGLAIGSFVCYSRMIRSAFDETYVECIVSCYEASLSGDGDLEYGIIVFLQRLCLLDRPEVFEGNKGRNGFKDKEAVVRLKLPFGQQLRDITESADYYALPGDPSPLVLTTAIIRYALIRLVRESGTLYRSFGVPRTPDKGISALKNSWPWIATIGFTVGAVLVALG